MIPWESTRHCSWGSYYNLSLSRPFCSVSLHTRWNSSQCTTPSLMLSIKMNCQTVPRQRVLRARGQQLLSFLKLFSVTFKAKIFSCKRFFFFQRPHLHKHCYLTLGAQMVILNCSSTLSTKLCFLEQKRISVVTLLKWRARKCKSGEVSTLTYT